MLFLLLMFAVVEVSAVFVVADVPVVFVVVAVVDVLFCWCC